MSDKVRSTFISILRIDMAKYFKNNILKTNILKQFKRIKSNSNFIFLKPRERTDHIRLD